MGVFDVSLSGMIQPCEKSLKHHRFSDLRRKGETGQRDRWLLCSCSSSAMCVPGRYSSFVDGLLGDSDCFVRSTFKKNSCRVHVKPNESDLRAGR